MAPMDDVGASSSGEKKVCRKVVTQFNADEIREHLMASGFEQLEKSVKIFSELKGEAPGTEEMLLDAATKLNYLHRIVEFRGVVPMRELYDFIVESCKDSDLPFESVQELASFVKKYLPIVKYSAELDYFQAPSNVFLTFVQFIASELKSGKPVDKTNIEKLIQQHLGKESREKKTTENFQTDGFYLDFSGLQELDASIPWFTFDRKTGSLSLTADHADGLALWLPILIPIHNPNDARHDKSHPIGFDAVVMKSTSRFQKSRMHGLGQFTGYMCHRLPEYTGNNELEDCQPAKSYITACAYPTWNEACQFKSYFTRDKPVGLDDLDDKPRKTLDWEKVNNGKPFFKKSDFEKDEKLESVGEEKEPEAVDERAAEKLLASKPNVAVDCTVTHLKDQHEESKAIEQLIELLERHKILPLEKIGKMYIERGEEQREAYEADREKVEKYNKAKKKEYRRTLQRFDPLEGLILERGDRVLKNVEEVVEFIKRHPEHFEVTPSGTVSETSKSVQRASDALRYMLFYHVKPITITEIKKKLEDQAWRAPHLVKCAESNKLEEFCDSLEFMQKSVHENDVIYTLNRHLAFPRSC